MARTARTLGFSVPPELADEIERLAAERVHAQLWAGLARSRTPVPAHGLWIAATCIAHGRTLVTTNERDFARIPGLSFEVWG
ncbi:MAG: hypothetical protein EG823_07900 [Actinobacteria bacterium]|nr:hypothetical protein [Actinomycetota bacterium]